MIRQNQGKINIVFIFFDISIVVICAYLAYFVLNRFQIIYFSSDNSGLALYIFIFICAHMFFYYRYEFYKSHRSNRFISELKQISKACLAAFISVQIIMFVLFRGKIAYEFTVFFALTNYIILSAYKYTVRKILRFIRSKGYNLKFLIIIGKNHCTESFIKKIEQQRGFGFKISGIFGDKSFDNIPFLGEMNDLDEYMANNMIDEAIITIPDNPELLKQIVYKCNYYGIKFTIMLDIFYIFNEKFYVYEFDNMLSVSTYKIPLENVFNNITKRAFDVVISLMSLILLSPLMIAVALIIKKTSEGGVIYKQKRMGLNKKEFIMYKFRSMKAGESKNAEQEMTKKHDSRCTKIGAFIRKYGIDELPQIFNVLKGDMSLIGPRPELPYHVSHFKDEIPLYMVKHYVKPGISGWAQVNGLRGNTSIEERIKYDIYYIENWSFWLDIKIIFLTFCKGVFNENAY